MRSLLSSTTAALGASIFATLGLTQLTACASDVTPAGEGGGGAGSGGSTSASIPSTSSSTSTSTGTGVPDHPPTCEELSTSSTASGSVGTTVGAGGQGPTGAGGGAALYARECDDPEPVVLGCLDTGVDRCANGFFVRREAVACPAWHRPAGVFTCGGEGECNVDADCGAGAICDQYFIGPPAGDGCKCVAGCETDDDCGAGQLCLCGEGAGQCVAATCRTDGDCGPGLHCASMNTGGCDPTIAFHCQSDSDACIDASECPADGIGDVGCVVDPSGARICETGHGCAAVGRPLVVDGQVRFAAHATRDDWSHGATVTATTCEASRAAAGAHWAHIAAMEHASVASFARFALELLSLGAPPDLVAGASSAMLDEIEHARLAYGIAGALGGAPIGPGRLDVSGAAPTTDLVALAVSTFREGCVAEGAAAAEAAIAAATSLDADIATTLGRVAREEATHAELAWRTIAWALDRDFARVAPALRDALADEAARAPERGEEPGLEAFGVLGPAERASIRDGVLRDVVAPVLGRLLASPARDRGERATASPIEA